MFDTIVLRGKLSINPFGGGYEFLLCRKTFQGMNLLDIIGNTFLDDNLFFNFLNICCNLPSIDFVGSWLSFIDWFVSSSSKHLLVY